MKTSIYLKEERSDIISQLENIKDVATTEERDLTSEENEQVDALLEEVDNLDVKITRAEKMETIKRNAAVVSGTVSEKVDKDISKYSFQEAMRQAYTGKLEGLTKEMDQEARAQARYTGQTYTGVAIPASVLENRAMQTAGDIKSTEIQSFTDQLDANLVLTSAGANLYTGVADAKFPIISGIESSFVTEDVSSDVSATGNAITAKTLSPKKLISVVDMSMEAMTQNSGLEAAIRRNMAQSVASTWEKALLGTNDITSAPESIFADAGAGSTDSTLAASTFIDLEAFVLGNNVPLEGARMAYLFDKDAYASIRTLLQTTGVAPLWNIADKELNNYFGFFSTNVGNGGASGKAHALFGDFSRCHLAQFGGIDILFDPYTLGRRGQASMVVTTLVDGMTTDSTTAFSTLIQS
tara:strand:+ start:7363 stop:8592 length:1230 start_codon:yes stop_codon:yes gene_type:complete